MAPAQVPMLANLLVPFARHADDPRPLYRQMYDGLRRAILDGTLPRGTRLPSTRALASQLGMSRNTVLNAFDQLLAEGYLESRVGSGTRVAAALPKESSAPYPRLPFRPTTLPARPRRLSMRGSLLASTPVTVVRRLADRAFRAGVPDLAAFPFDIWSRLSARRLRRPSASLVDYGDPAGFRPLREAIAAYLRAARGVRCDADQVLIVSGSQQGLDVAARMLLDPGDTVWMEDPGYSGARGALIAAGAHVCPVPVDSAGLDVAVGRAIAPGARLAYVTPSHQYPLGVAMPLTRRLALLDWARRADAWVLEDDYDSEYRYTNRPLAALQGLDTEGRVVYIGSFSKVLFPGLRLGYLVVPRDLVEGFTAGKALADRHAATLDQAVLADFIAERHFERHMHRMRSLYAERQIALVDQVQRNLAGVVEVEPADTGMHLVAWLPPQADDRAAAERAFAAGVEMQPVSAYTWGAPVRPGLVLGYAAFSVEQIRDGVRRLTHALLPK